jgi:Sulfatase
MVLAWLAVVPCVSCSRVDPPPGPGARRVVARLADDVLADSHGAPGHMNIRGVMRYVVGLPGLSFLYLEPGERHELRATEGGAIELSMPCPDVLRGRDVVAYIGGPEQSHEQVIHCPDAAGEPLALRFQGFEPDEAVLGLVLARELPVNHIETRAHRVGPGATLELAIAHVAAEPPQRATPSWVRIVAQGADGRAETLLDRTLDPAARPADRGWVDLQMPLHAVRTALGPDLRFIFESGSDEGSLRPGLPVWWADPTIFEPRAEPHEAVPRNVVLVSIDTLRPDRLGFYGAVRPTSAVLDRLAADGTVFDVAVAQAPWTLPSHATMLTGLYGCVHGTVERQLPRNDLRAFPHRRAQPGRRQHARGGAQPADACDHRRHDDRQRSAALRRLPDLCATLNPTGRRWTGRGVP